MNRYIDADRIDWRLIIPTNATIAEENMIHLAKKLVERQPTADVVEIIPCKDCKYHGATIEEQPTPSIMCAHMHDNDYCSYGERREDAEIH